MKGIEGLTLGRYELRRRVAQGGMAEIYLAYDRRVRRQVAIKVLYGRNEAFIRRFEREALAVGALTHNHILPLYDFGEQRPWYYLVMPYVEGGNLRDYLRKRSRLSLEEAASFLDQIAAALQYAHDHGVVHRDVKPSNILLRPDGYAYLVDFGLAKAIMETESLTSEGAMIGTPEYMAPEQSNGMSDYRSDIYSLGVILYQMLTGRVPFMAESPVAILLKHIQAVPTPPGELNTELPASIESVILKAMAKEPGERYQQAREVSHAYWRALQQERLPSGIRSAASEEHSTSTGETDEPISETPAITRILEETRQALAEQRPPMLPLQISLTDASDSGKEQARIPSLPFLRRAARRKHRLAPAIIALLCLISIFLALPLGLITWQAQREHHQRTTTSAQTVSSTAPTWLTTTAQAQATLAAQARAQATAGITSSLGAGNILYANDLTTPGGGWIDDGSQCYFTAQGYHVHTSYAREVAWCYTSQQTFSNVIITAQAQLLYGDIYGLVFRLNPNSHEFYVLEVDKAGSYRFVRASGRDPLNWLTLIDWTPSSAILTGYGATNTFLVVANNAQFRFYINRQLVVTTFTDTTYVSGFIGFLVGGDGPGGTEAVFSNVWVFQK